MSHFRAMDIDRFWALIEQARATAGPTADQAVRDFDEPDDDPNRDYWDFDDLDVQAALMEPTDSTDSTERDASAEEGDEVDGEDDEDEYDDEEDDVTDPIAVALLDILSQLTAEEIAAFDNLFEDLRVKAESDDIANAAVLIEHGFLGDDSFDDFRAGLVALGRTAFEAAIANPDSLAGHPLVREIAQANDPRWLGREDMLFVASHAYAAVTGEDEVTFYDYAEDQREDAEGHRHVEGAMAGQQDVEGQRDAAGEQGEQGEDDEEKPEDEWSVTDEAETRRRLPRLSDLFYERSMRNRQRAMEKLGLPG